MPERYRLVILSNVDRRSFAASNRRLGVVFDRIVTAEDVGTYKPDRAMFDALLAAVEAMGSERSRLLHVAESLYHDHQSAAEAGIDSVWIHRRFDRDGFGATHPPDGDVHPKWRFTSMAAFAEAAVPFPRGGKVAERDAESVEPRRKGENHRPPFPSALVAFGRCRIPPFPQRG